MRPHQGLEVRTLDDYRRRYAQYKGDPSLQAAHAAFPWILTWDDHEVENNYAGLISEDNDVPGLALSVRGADGVQRYGWTAPAPKNRLAPGEAITFRARLAAPPEDGVEVVVGFASGETPAADRLDLGDLRPTTDDGRVTERDIPNPAKMP